MESAENGVHRPRCRWFGGFSPVIVAAGLAVSSVTHAQVAPGPELPSSLLDVQANPIAPQNAPVQSDRVPETAQPEVGGSIDALKTPINREESATEWNERSDSARNPIWTTLGVLCLLLSGLFGILQLMRRFGPRRFVATGQQHIQLVDRRRLDSQTTVYLLRIGQRVIVAGSSTSGLSTLAEIDDPREVAEILGHQSQTDAETDSLQSLFSGMRPIRREAETREQAPAKNAEVPVTSQLRAAQESWHA